jgi:DNA-binding transcriptional ArsR family regulator
MQHDDAVTKLAELGHGTRLAVYRLLVKAGSRGLAVSEIQQQLQVPNSTLSHHISKLVAAGLMNQSREGRVLRCHANYAALSNLMGYLSEECCASEQTSANACC